ncbi:peptidoglycan-binding protein [Actinocorallia longicatena]|uniref:Peptidoglycan-binding protein n=1 Tax=Actinocorallia longicatena TaxID=111803 RepID=A0ABP6Q5V0_9ACTN
MLAVGGAGVIGVAAVWAAAGFGGSDGDASTAPTGPPATAKIEKRTLTRTETVAGNLGFGDVRSVAARPGTITWVPSDGETVERGETVYSLDGHRIPLFYGATPVYRTLSSGTEGKDVRVVEKNLAALGYDGFTVDGTYTSGTADAVERWQDDLGLDTTGTITQGSVIVAPGAIRVGEVKLGVGDPGGGTVLTWTGTTRKVTVELKAEHEDLVAEGTRATVELPDGATVKAVVTRVGSAATAEAQQGGTTKAADATLPVELAVRDQKGLGRYQSAPVDVTLEAESRKDVLAVPVTALVALREGGYAVEIVTGGVSSYVRVETGVFAGGLVEVTGAGLGEGLVVGVPQ